ncbi:M14 family metallopeptidase [Actinoallomurus bryophytorum]|uniref:Zinc carboxypeptidase n=1 Tax=Actinoallomurus bryophytorum TaxID=1490222 RepID=A0A543CG51_9ACTN|nr:M14 family metallopeptidase [Actinoallomurus bryophytorum]TQL96071.1 immune inhibitor A peptidase M6 [Actinoallomurus bryophytorum]
MKRLSTSVLAAMALIGGLLAAAPAAASPPRPAKVSEHVDLYAGDIPLAQTRELHSAGLDSEDIQTGKVTGNKVHVEVLMGGRQARRLQSQGLDLRLQVVGGKTAAERATPLAAKGDNVFRPYSGPGNIREEMLNAAASHAGIAQAVDIGTTGQGKPITAIKVTKNARSLRSGSRPAVVYQGTQHAREWIATETVRRSLHYYLDNYGKNRDVTKLVDTDELWFIPVVNVDGYDYTFTPGNRFWRKNLRDNDGDGQITSNDGVDPNRNFSFKWGYDNEGSSANTADETYRGPSAGSEPETKAQVALYKKIRPKFMLNWHSAAELLLHGVGWQTLTRSPDDVLHEAILGDIDHAAVPGYTPELGAQLYTTNGETDGYAESVLGTLTYTPEQSTCRTAVGSDPDDDWTLADCGTSTGQTFAFPDSETLIQKEFEKNLPLLLDLAKSAHDPAHPVSPVGRTVPDFAVDAFTASYGSSQPVASVIRRSLPGKRLRYRVNGGPAHSSSVHEWQGGERYGRDSREYFGEYRGTIGGLRPKDRVQAWFVAGGKVSQPFTFTVRDQKGAKVLVLADEDYKGVNPVYPPGTSAPKYAQQYVEALKAAKVKAAVWDIDADGAPHDLGVLSHFKGVVWYLGDNRLTQDAADEFVPVGGQPFPDSQIADREVATTLAVRDYLNEGGKLIYTGETTGYDGPLAGSNGGGIYYGLKGHPERPCVVTINLRDDCELFADDFMQYYLGAYSRVVRQGPTGFSGTGAPLSGVNAPLASAANPLDEAGNFDVTSDNLPVAQFPQFKSSAAGEYSSKGGPFDPVEGSWYAAGPHADSSYMRLTRTIDLSGVTAAQAPKLAAQLSYDTEEGYDNVIVEAHTAGTDDWTTLPDLGGRSDTGVPAECDAGFLLAMHPWLKHYLTLGTPCGGSGTSGSWNRFTGNSGGWVPVSFDLSAYAGKKMEVSISYVTDPASGGIGAFVDDTKVTTAGGTSDAEGFEAGLGPWSVPGAPAGSPANVKDFHRAQGFGVAAIATPDTLLFGFGLEQVASPADRNRLMALAIRRLLG